MIDQAAFDRLFRLLYGELYAFARRFLNESADCEDVVSGAFEDVWTNAKQIEEGATRAYLYKNIRNKCIDHLRREATRRRHAELYAKLSMDYDRADRLAEMNERERIIKKVLDTLPDYTRKIFTACYVERQSYAEVAQLMNISTSTVKKYISRALQQIAEMRNRSTKTA